MKLGFEKKKKKKNVAQPNTNTVFHVYRDRQNFCLLYFGPSPYLVTRYSLTKKKNSVASGLCLCGLWVCFVCNANKELPRTVNSTVSVSKSAMSRLLYIFCIFCSVYLLSAQINWEEIEGFEISTGFHLCSYSYIRFAASLVYLYCFALFHLFG